MVAGEADGWVTTWYASGAVKSRVHLKEGEILEREFFDDPTAQGNARNLSLVQP